MFTALLRKILNNVHGAGNRRHWIIFDGDVDPEWAENLNSVLDDNKLLTLPNGERLQIPPNVRLLFEVDNLIYATLATVSRCGMVWFSEDVLSEDAIALHFLNSIRYAFSSSCRESAIRYSLYSFSCLAMERSKISLFNKVLVIQLRQLLV